MNTVPARNDMARGASPRTSQVAWVHRRKVIERGFTKSPNDLLFNADLSAAAYRVLMAVLSYPDGTHITQDKIAADLHATKGFVNTACKQLAAQGYIHQTTWRDAKGHKRYTVHYYDQPAEAPVRVTAEQPQSENPESDFPTTDLPGQTQESPAQPVVGFTDPGDPDQVIKTGSSKTDKTLSRETSIEGRTAAILSSALGEPLTDEEGQELMLKLTPPGGYKHTSPIPYLTTVARDNPELIRQKHEQVTAPYNRYQPGPDFFAREVAAAW